MEEAIRVVRQIAPQVTFEIQDLGSAAITRYGDPLPDVTLAACKAADAVLMGAVGTDTGHWAGQTPEEGMFRLRQELSVYANLRPFSGTGFDLLIVRELNGGLYYGRKGTRPDGTVFDTCEYHPKDVERVVRKAFDLARGRGGTVTSVDKANVLATSRMWRTVTKSVALDYPDIELTHLLADTAAMQLITNPERFDVIVTENTFGDILSDVAAAIGGGLGLAASACLGTAAPGLFEPVHGTAPDIAGQGVANPAAMIRSAAMMLELGLGLTIEAQAVHRALDHALATTPTRDLGGAADTAAFGDAVLVQLETSMEGDLA